MRSFALSTDFVKRISSSTFNYWAGYAANITLVAWLVAQAFTSEGSLLSALEWTALVVAGFFLWTLLEYALHRYAYHEVSSALSVGHNLHHDEPKALIGVPWYFSAVIVVGVFYLAAAVFGPAYTGVLMGSTWLGYIGYCFIHHSIHHFDFKNPWFRAMRKHHLKHHVKDGYNWGITLDWWDRLFGTKV